MKCNRKISLQFGHEIWGKQIGRPTNQLATWSAKPDTSHATTNSSSATSSVKRREEKKKKQKWNEMKLSCVCLSFVQLLYDYIPIKLSFHMATDTTPRWIDSFYCTFILLNGRHERNPIKISKILMRAGQQKYKQHRLCLQQQYKQLLIKSRISFE